ncbi:A/G-specific adenine glycosylase [Acididesulfobacillus acetoxydans]|uniref:A/G-specific adenine glycosylase n=1 Tax=Acididesulfobacillus acetoxydans TaxID=1561005 RepID=UPI001F0FAC24|nr:A/G-specific adenine glycosylase [Acididesulfobacillus acetoxydans]
MEKERADGSFADRLLAWFRAEKRDLPWRRTTDPYRIWVSEVMLQQTQVKTVLPYYEEFLRRFPTPEDLAGAELNDVLTAWRGLGYYARARHLWQGARHVLSVWSGKIPSDYETLLQIPGVGEYTAGAIASIAFGQKVPALDGNVRRVMARLLAWPEPAAKASASRRFREQLRAWQPAACPGDFNQALMELGATVCSPRSPHCPDCPISSFCQAFSSGNLAYPVRIPKKRPETMLRLTFVLLHKGTIYLQKRPAGGLLADLWEFPGLELPFSGVPPASVPAVDPMSRAARRLPVSPGKGANPSRGASSGPSLPAPDPDALTHEHLGLTPAEWLAFYRDAVTKRTFDREAERFFQGDFPLYGPVGHTFSHLRWELYWVIITIGGTAGESPSLRLPLATAGPTGPTGPFPGLSLRSPGGSSALSHQKTLLHTRPGFFSSPSLLRETPPAPPTPTSLPNSTGSWVAPEALAEYPLPSAFSAILEHVRQWA